MKSPALLAALALGLLGASAPAASPAPTGRQVLERAVHRQNFQDATLRIRLQKTKHATGRTKTMTLVVYQKVWPQMVTTLVEVESPDEARGISFLTWDYQDPKTPDEKWYYLPQINRYRKLDPDQGQKYEEQFGFSMDIFAVDLEAADHKLLGEETVDGAKCWKIESVMKDPQSPRGARILTWVRQDNYVAAKIQAFDPAGKLIRDFKLTDLKQFGPYWQETGGTYTDQTKGQTLVFQISDAKFDTHLPDDQFISTKLQEKAEKLRKQKP
jgi:hypothetical protein